MWRCSDPAVPFRICCGHCWRASEMFSLMHHLASSMCLFSFNMTFAGRTFFDCIMSHFMVVIAFDSFFVLFLFEGKPL